MFRQKVLLSVLAFALLVVVGRQVAADATDTNTSGRDNIQRGVTPLWWRI